MKHFYCTVCEDMVKMRLHKRTCECGESWGQYTNKPTIVDGKEYMEEAIVGGNAIPYGIDNIAFIRALKGHSVAFFGFFYEPPGFVATDKIIVDDDSVFHSMKATND